MSFNLVELMFDGQHPSPCAHGNIVDDHACYCHAPTPNTPRKCPIWRNYGEHDLTKWKRGTWKNGNCPYFKKPTARPAPPAAHGGRQDDHGS